MEKYNDATIEFIALIFLTHGRGPAAWENVFEERTRIWEIYTKNASIPFISGIPELVEEHENYLTLTDKAMELINERSK